MRKAVFSLFLTSCLIPFNSPNSQEYAYQYIKIDESSVLAAAKLAAARTQDSEKWGDYAVFVNGVFAGLPSDTLALPANQPVALSIVTRTDGHAWTNSITASDDPEPSSNLVSLYTWSFGSAASVSNESCDDWCDDIFLMSEAGIKLAAFTDKAIFASEIYPVSFGLGPIPDDNDDRKTIRIETSPPGAEIRLEDGRRHALPTDCDISFRFKRLPKGYAPRQLTLISPDRVSVVVEITYDDTVIRYDFNRPWPQIPSLRPTTGLAPQR